MERSFKGGDAALDERAVWPESQAFRSRCRDSLLDSIHWNWMHFVPSNCLPLEHAVTEAWVSVEQIAEHLGVKRDSIYR
jgi:hypothetical protein